MKLTFEFNQNNGILNQKQDSIINKMFESYKENSFALRNEVIMKKIIYIII